MSIQDVHADVFKRITEKKPGYAQSSIGDIRVSFIRSKDLIGTFTHGHHIEKSFRDVIEEMILDVARGEGLASPRTFTKFRVQYMINDRREYPSYWTKKHKEAEILENFYIEGEGREILFDT